MTKNHSFDTNYYYNNDQQTKQKQKQKQNHRSSIAASSLSSSSSVKSNWMVIDSSYIHKVAENATGRNCDGSVDFLANHLKATASSSTSSSNHSRNNSSNHHHHYGYQQRHNNKYNTTTATINGANERIEEEEEEEHHNQRTSTKSRSTSSKATVTTATTNRNSSGSGGEEEKERPSSRASMEDNYSQAMSRMNRGGDFDPNYNAKVKNKDSYGSTRTGCRGGSSSSGGTTTSYNRSTSSSNHNDTRARTSGTGEVTIDSTNTTNSKPTRMARRGDGSSVGESKNSHIFSTTSRLSRSSNQSSTVRSNNNDNGQRLRSTDNQKKPIVKRGISNKDPSDEIIAIFGAYGVTGHHFLKFAMEAGYKVKALVLPGMDMDDVAGSGNLRLVTGSFEEMEKVRMVVHNATYVVCLLNDCDPSLHLLSSSVAGFGNQENFPPPIGNIGYNTTNNDDGDDDDDNNDGTNKKKKKKDDNYHPFSLNLNFMHNLVPILEQSKTCRVLLYQASSLASDGKGTTPILSKVVKKLAVRKNWKGMKREQDKIVKYIVNQTKNASFNYIITRPSDTLIRDGSSRKKLAASKSQPGPFPITNIDLADFSLSALRMNKIYNSCPFVVQDGV